MFEYHGSNLTVDADGVNVTVALAEPLDIEKPLAELNLITSEVTAVSQFVVSRNDLPPYADNEPEEDAPSDDYHFINGYTSSDWSDGVDYEGEGNAEVIARAVPFLELGVKGLMTFCSQESQVLEQWLEEAHVRSDGLEQIAKERAEAEAAELERIMPKRDSFIALKELKQFIDENCLDPQASRTFFWKEVSGKRLVFYEPLGSIGFWDDKGEYFSTWDSVQLHQDFEPGKHNPNLGEVRVSEQGYFTAGKKTTLDEIFHNDARDCQDFRTVEEALEYLVPYILEGEEDSDLEL